MRKETIIRVPVSTNAVYGKMPLLIGLLCPIHNSGYIQKYFSRLITTLTILEVPSEHKETISEEMSGLDINNMEDLNVLSKEVTLKTEEGSTVIHKTFKIVNKNKEIKELPLYRDFNQTVYYNSYRFEEYRPYNYRSDKQQTTEDWYKSEFGDDADTAWWNTH